MFFFPVMNRRQYMEQMLLSRTVQSSPVTLAIVSLIEEVAVFALSGPPSGPVTQDAFKGIYNWFGFHDGRAN